MLKSVPLGVSFLSIDSHILVQLGGFCFLPFTPSFTNSVLWPLINIMKIHTKISKTQILDAAEHCQLLLILLIDECAQQFSEYSYKLGFSTKHKQAQPLKSWRFALVSSVS